MGLSLVTGPTTEPVSLAEAKDHCRISSPDEDGLLAGYVIAARKFAEGMTHRAFLTQTWDYSIDYSWPCAPYSSGMGLTFWDRRIEIPLPPLQSVTSVSYVDTAGAGQTLASNQYVVRTDGSFGLIVPAYGVTWPDVRCQVAAITVRFVAGWTEGTFPDDLRQALLLLIGHFNENREAVSVNANAVEIPMAAEALISGYRSLRL